MFKLVIQDDEGKTTVVPLIRDEITIGRKEGNTIRLTERNVSRKHARIVRNNGEVHIEDLNSYNGIRVNNARIAERVSLRVSDQVQIGDYKLYLKAEGVEQVDDARTMPIERIDNALPTEVMPAVATAPMSAQIPTVQAPPIIPPGAIPGTPQPNRSPAAVADTDPSGRPVATAAQVAAMTQPVGYGKLVVVSSNFAGKEFDLTRPQMIIGRTDENDIVVNHRSISRNHAKVTRDPESARYTISDLQSSNGVRVNGQDYGKVEMRRGDTVDLGHVRFRFVEPGEDFVFARDAVIADIHEGGSKRGLLVAVLLGVLVLGGIGAYYALNKEKTGDIANKGGDTNGMNDGSDTKIVANGSNTTTNNGMNTGSDTTHNVTPTPDDPNDAAAQQRIECKQNISKQEWSAAKLCAEKLAATDPASAKELKATIADEIANELSLEKVKTAVSAKNLTKAKKEAASIEDDSSYRTEANKLLGDLEKSLSELLLSNANALKAKNNCKELDKAWKEALEKGLKDAADSIEKMRCTQTAGGGGGGTTGGGGAAGGGGGGGGGGGTTVAEKPDCSNKLADNSAACKKQFCAGNGDDPRCGGGKPDVQAPAGCDAEAAKEKGMTNINMGQHAAALAQFEASLRCKDDPYVRQLAFMESCASSNSAKAKLYYKKLTPPQQAKFAQICIRQKPPVAYE